jgi:predicted nucleic acid-binding protein
MRYLLDTNVVSEPSRPRPDRRVLTWMEARRAHLAVSAITFGEIEQGITLLDPGRRRRELSRWLEEEVSEQYRDQVIPVDVPIAREWGRIAVMARRAGRGISIEDGLLLATATTRNLVLVTRNERDFRWHYMHVLNPWNGEEP